MPPSNSTPKWIDAAEFAWLATSEASRWLAEIASSELPLHTLTGRIRRELSATRCHLLLEQAEVRRRAAAKFTRAAQMLFTPRLLEQATDEWISRYKAQRFAGLGNVADLCCGVGGDLIGLAEVNRTIGIDQCEVASYCARYNLVIYQTVNVSHSEIKTADVNSIEPSEFSAWHLDPDRRPQGKRTTRVELHEPSLATIERMLSKQPTAAIKLAPASDLPKNEAWIAQTEFEWISRGGECRQLVAWRGLLAHNLDLRRATNVSPKGIASFAGQPEVQPDLAQSMERYVFEPDAAVRAAHLSRALAIKHGLEALAPGIPYFTGPNLLDEPLVATFEVDDVMPFDRRTLAAYLGQRGVGRVEIKHRGLELAPDRLRAELKLRGDAAAVLLIAKIFGKATVIIAKRLETRG